jgi:hypothetical protein
MLTIVIEVYESDGGEFPPHWGLRESTSLCTIVSIGVCEFYCMTLVTTTKSLLIFATICIAGEGSGSSGKEAGGYLKQAQNSSAHNPPSQTSALVIHSLFQMNGSVFLISYPHTQGERTYA